MKRIFSIFVCLCVSVFAFFGCANQPSASTREPGAGTENTISGPDPYAVTEATLPTIEQSFKIQRRDLMSDYPSFGNDFTSATFSFRDGILRCEDNMGRELMKYTYDNITNVVSSAYMVRNDTTKKDHEEKTDIVTLLNAVFDNGERELTFEYCDPEEAYFGGARIGQGRLRFFYEYTDYEFEPDAKYMKGYPSTVVILFDYETNMMYLDVELMNTFQAPISVPTEIIDKYF